MADAAIAEISEGQRPRYQFVDDIPEVAEARSAEREWAVSILAGRTAVAAAGETEAESLPLPVDALSTAHKVLAADDPETSSELRKGLVQDCLRLVGEAYRTLSSEYFAPTRHHFDHFTQSFFSHGLSIKQMTENGLSVIEGNDEEMARRVNEYVENETTRIMRAAGFAGACVLTISECPDWALQKYQDDVDHERPTGGYMGYVPQISKNMFRGISTDTESSDRIQVQIGTSGEYHTHDIILRTLKRLGLDAEGLDKTGLHAAQIKTEDDIFEFIRALDEMASEEWCVDVFMGEKVDKDHPKDYKIYKQEALARQESLKDFAEVLTVYVMRLAEDNVDPRQALPMIEDFVKLELLAIAKSHIAKDEIDVAKQMFADHTVRGLQWVVALEQQGYFRQAQTAFNDVSRLASIGFCGADGCGMESVDERTDEGKQIREKLHASSSDTVVKDKERSCPSCRTKNLWYAYSKTQVTKYCSGCGLYESKVSKVA